MQIRISRHEPLQLDEADDFTTLSIVPIDMSAAEAGAHFGETGTADGPDHVRLAVSTLRKILRAESDRARARQFESMIGYAKGKGWVDEQNRVRIHIDMVRQPAARS